MLCGLGCGNAWLFGPSVEEKLRSCLPSPRVGSSSQLGVCSRLCRCAPPTTPPVGTDYPRAGRGTHYTLDRAGVCTVFSGGSYTAGLGVDRAGERGGRDYPDATGLGILACHWDRARA